MQSLVTLKKGGSMTSRAMRHLNRAQAAVLVVSISTAWILVISLAISLVTSLAEADAAAEAMVR